MNIDEIMTLVKAVSDYNLTSFELEEGNVKISLKREKEMPQIVTVGAPAMDAASAAVSAQMMGAAMAAQAAPAAAGVVAEPAADAGISSDKVVTSLLVGTFYNASSPDAEAFVREGDTVKKGQVLGIIEAMKLMNEIESEFDGVVEAVLVKNEEVVEYGQPLFRIR
ncbi:MAG: acetyl-CoA carboxylase biotin carboxyl carrier protein [Clostridium sp.]|nr:acetyl-CoA carboxylase biotin carboxyl carrier protein [Clostridium sp.]